MLQGGQPVKLSLNNHYYQYCQKYHDDEKTEWASARQKCQEQEADLIIVNNDLENLFVFDFARENSIDVWLGILENVSNILI